MCTSSQIIEYLDVSREIDMSLTVGSPISGVDWSIIRGRATQLGSAPPWMEGMALGTSQSTDDASAGPGYLSMISQIVPDQLCLGPSSGRSIHTTRPVRMWAVLDVESPNLVAPAAMNCGF